ncbi:MAG: acetylxylan esterase [Paludibacteraceae bacterium]|nr:acetylxylan esterase [Paludibacteraceae bacterium]
MKYRLYIISLLMFLCACGCENKGQNGPDGNEPVEQPDLSLVTASVPVTNDWVWSGKPQITIHIENPNAGAVRMGVKIRISTDSKKLVEEVADSVDVAGNGKQDFTMSTTAELEPGFYRAVCFVNDKNVRSFIFGIDPFQIVSLPDKQPDYDAFWQAAKDQLAAIDMNPRLIELPNKSTDKRKVYLVELNSVPDGLTGEPVVVRGYYCEPQDGQKHPVVMHFYGYDYQNVTTKVECPNGNASPYAEFYLSHRGQYINNRPESSREPDGLGELKNIYGDWFAYHFGDKDSYYYRGAFMDVVQAVRFMATRETSDMTHLFAEGSSQGGALSYAAAALSDYPFTAIAPNVAFLGDFADALTVGGMAMEIAKANKGSMSNEEMLAFLSYFDTKNLATRISCAVMASSGLQDGVCPPRTNVVPFNNLRTPEADKQYVFGPEMGHDYPKGWNPMAFFKKYM